jgi:hypothetical protein
MGGLVREKTLPCIRNEREKEKGIISSRSSIERSALTGSYRVAVVLLRALAAATAGLIVFLEYPFEVLS